MHPLSLSMKYCFLPYPVRISLIYTSVVFLNFNIINLTSSLVTSRENICHALPLWMHLFHLKLAYSCRSSSWFTCLRKLTGYDSSFSVDSKVEKQHQQLSFSPFVYASFLQKFSFFPFFHSLGYECYVMVSSSSVVDKVDAYLEVISCGSSGSCWCEDVNCDSLACTLERWRRMANRLLCILQTNL